MAANSSPVSIIRFSFSWNLCSCVDKNSYLEVSYIKSCQTKTLFTLF